MQHKKNKSTKWCAFCIIMEQFTLWSSIKKMRNPNSSENYLDQVTLWGMPCLISLLILVRNADPFFLTDWFTYSLIRFIGTVKPRITEHTGDQMICSDIRIIRVCESVQRNAYIDQGITDCLLTWVRVYGAILVKQIRNTGLTVCAVQALVVAIHFNNSHKTFGYSPWKKWVNRPTFPSLCYRLEICRHQHRFSSYFRNLTRQRTKHWNIIHHVTLKDAENNFEWLDQVASFL